MPSALWVFLMVAACDQPISPVDHGSCDAMIGCASAVTPTATAGLVQGYGAQGSCWADPGYAATCRQACDSSLKMLHDAFPGEAACGLPQMGNRPDYPAGPFGSSEGSQIANLELQAKADPAGADGTTPYSSLDVKTLRLSDYYGDPNVDWLLMSVVNLDCGVCLAQAQTVRPVSEKWEPAGVRFLTVLVYRTTTSQAKAQPSDIDVWQKRTGEHTAIAVDAADDSITQLTEWPTTLLIRTSDMTIRKIRVGSSDLDAFLDAYAN
jgi:hypothetical protein